MKDSTLNAIAGIGIITLVILLVLPLLTDPILTGNVVRTVPDYQQYKAKMTNDAFHALSVSSSFARTDYIVALNDYEKDKKGIYDQVPEYYVKELPLVDAIAISARKSQLMSILENENVSMVYLDKPVELLRTEALNLTNITSIRRYGPVQYNVTGNGIKIGIIDSGVDYSHSEFCTPGEDGCFISRSVSILGESEDIVPRYAIEDKFSDHSTSRIINLSSGAKNVTVKLHGPNYIFAASLNVNTTSFSVSINGTSITPSTTLDFTDALNNIACSSDDCYYNLTFSGTGMILVKNLSVDYTFAHVENIATADDLFGHGTAVLGIVHSVAPDAEVYMYGILDENGEATTSDLISAIELAILDDVDIISMSIGSPRPIGESCEYMILKDAIDKAYEDGITLVAAAGNDPEYAVYYPACFDNVVAIGSINDNNIPSYFTTPGEEVDFAMPGEDINSTNISGTYGLFDGTSFSTPFASGVFALMQEMAINNVSRKLLPFQLYSIAKDSAQDVYSSGKDNYTGYGLLQVSRLMSNITKNTDVFSNIESLSFSSSRPDATIELYTLHNSTRVSINWTNISINSSKSVPLYLNGSASARMYNITPNTTYIYTTINSSALSTIGSGVYTSGINISNYYDGASLLNLPVSMTVAGLPANYTYRVGLFSEYEMSSAAIEIIVYLLGNMFSGFANLLECSSEYNVCIEGCHDEIVYTDCENECSQNLNTCNSNFNVSTMHLSEPTMNYLSFFSYGNYSTDNVTYNNYTMNNVFNLADYLILMLNASDASIDNYYLKISGPNGDTNLNGIASTGYDNLYYFTEDGKQPSIKPLSLLSAPLPKRYISALSSGDEREFISQVVAFEDLYDSNLYFFDRTGNYAYEIIAEIDGMNSTVEKSNFIVLNNFTLLLRNGMFFLNENNSIAFDVKDNRGYIINKILPEIFDYNIYNYNYTLYGIPTITANLSGRILNLSVSTQDLTSFLSNSSFSEGLYSLNLTYSVANNTQSVLESVTLSYPVSLNISLNSSLRKVNQTSNISYSLNFSKQGSLQANVSVNMSLDSSCDDYVSLNITQFNDTGLHSSSTNAVHYLSIYKSATNTYENICTLYVQSDVYGICQHCGSSSVYSYTNLDSVQFALDGESPINISAELNDSSLYYGEYAYLMVNISNNGSNNLSLDVYANLTSSSQNLSFNYTNLTVGNQSLKTINFTAVLNATGAYNLTVVATNGLISKSYNRTITVLDELVTLTFAVNSSRLYVNDTVNLTLKVRNNNNKAINVTVFNYSISNMSYNSSTGSTLSLNASQEKNIYYILKVLGRNNTRFNITTRSDNFSKVWGYQFVVNSGKLYNISLKDDFKDYTIDLNDTLSFMVDNGCNETYKSCKTNCTDNNRSCKAVCKSAKDTERAQKTACKDSCTSIADSDDRRSCRDDCDDEFNYIDDDYADCQEDCFDIGEECADDCTEDYDDCMDEAVIVETTTVHEADDTYISLYFDVDDEEFDDLYFTEGNSTKFDFDDNGYYDVEFVLSKLVLDENYKCEDNCKSNQTADKNKCENISASCKTNCTRDYDDNDDEADCKDDCSDDMADCKDLATEDYEDCLDTCQIIYSDYKIKIRKLEGEKVPVSNITYYHYPRYNVTTTNITQNQTNSSTGTNASNTTNTTPIRPTLTCSAQNLDLCKDKVSCGTAKGYWYTNSCHLQPEQVIIPERQCSSQYLSLCVDEANCVIAGGFWYDSICNAEEEIQPILIEPDDETGSSGSSSSNLKPIIIIGISAFVIFGIATASLSLRRKKLYQEATSSATSDKEDLMDYFMKQLEKGNSLSKIVQSLKQLGRDPAKVDSIAHSIMADPTKQMVVRIVGFALQYQVKDPAAIKQRFSQVDQHILDQAMEELTRRMNERV